MCSQAIRPDPATLPCRVVWLRRVNVHNQDVRLCRAIGGMWLHYHCVVFRVSVILEVKICCKSILTVVSIRCPEFRGSQVVASQRLVINFLLGPEALSPLGSVSTSPSVQFWRFYCIHVQPVWCVSYSKCHLIRLKVNMSTHLYINFVEFPLEILCCRDRDLVLEAIKRHPLYSTHMQ